MRTCRFTVLPLFLLTLVGGACTITIGPYEDGDGTAPRDTPVLPEPNGEGPGDEPPLDEAQQARKEEADRYIREKIYKGGEILESIQLPSGDILDFITRDAFPALPLETPPVSFSPEDQPLPPWVQLGLTEIEQIPELLELAAMATPFHRPTFWPYILGEAPDATSIEDYLARYQVGGEPSTTKRLYAGLVSLEPNRGVSGHVNQFRPEVETGSFSLIELAVTCPADGPAQELVGIVISVDKKNKFGRNRNVLQDGEPRLHIEYARQVNGQAKFNWDGMDGEFVPNPLRRHHPGQKVPVSVLDETVVEHLMAIFQSPGSGDWWVAYNGELLGYYPATLFTILNEGACGSAWYGEVFNRQPGKAVETEMGSGEFAEAGLLNAAHVRNPKFYDLFWSGMEPKDNPSLSMAPNQPLCYNRMPLVQLAAPSDNTFLFLGGPGGKNPGCQWP